MDLGVVYDPSRNELFQAVKGEGAYLNNKKIKVSEIDRLSDALVTSGFAYSRGKALEKNLKNIKKFFDSEIHGIRRTGAASLDLCYVGCGRIDGFWEYGIKPWDHAAGSLIVKEAGGKITRIDGKPYELFKNDILVSNSRLHNQMLELIG